MIYNIGQECGFEFNFYLVCGKENFLIDGTSSQHGKQALEQIEKHVPISNITAVIFTGTTPVKSGYLKYLLEKNRNIKVYATVTGLRNIKEVLNFDFDGVMCKHKSTLSLSGTELEFFVTPNVPDPDNMMIHYKDEGALFSGTVFSEDCYSFLAGNSDFTLTAIEIAENLGISRIYSSYGNCIENVVEAVNEGKKLFVNKEKSGKKVLVAYTSLTGNNKKIAEAAREELTKHNVNVAMVSLEEQTPEIYDYDGLVLATYTKSRNMPECVWSFLNSIDVARAKDIPYLVLGSCGWSNEGAYMANEILSMLKLKKLSRADTCVFTPDYDNITEVKDKAKLLALEINKITENTNA